MKPKKGKFEESICWAVKQSDFEDYSEVEKQLLMSIKGSPHQNVTWDSEEKWKQEIKRKVKKALIDFYRLQSHILGYSALKTEEELRHRV